MLVLIAAHAAVAALLPALAPRAGRAVWWVAALVPLATLVWAAALTPGVLDGDTPVEHFGWAPSLGLEVVLRLDALSLLMTVIVSGVGAAVLFYGARYTSEGHGRESALLLAFAGVMLGLVTADNLLVLYVFWELTTVVSFLLIAGRGRTREHRQAAQQALVVTTGGGLAMLLGFVMLGETAGTYRISELVADPPDGGYVPAALVLVLVGVFTKSAQFPLHGWLPAAMVAPTTVSAYLHAAAMVKAGVYLTARLAPGFADTEPWRPLVLTVGLLSLVLGAWRALWESDLKRVLAYGTISELGLLIALFGYGTRNSALAGEVMLLAHATFKASLFLITGLVEHHTGTREIGRLSGLGRRRPVLLALAALAAASMAGLPPLVGYLGHEAYFDAFWNAARQGPGAGEEWVLAALVAGSTLTVAYAVRYLWGAFASRPGAEPTPQEDPGDRAPGMAVPIAALVTATVALGVWYPGTETLTEPYADRLPSPQKPYHLALWHGLSPALGLSAAALAAGLLLYRLRPALAALRERAPRAPDAQKGYRRTEQGLDRAALGFTRRTQVGSLPVYLTVLLTTVLVVPGTALLLRDTPFTAPPLWASAIQVPLGVVVLTAAVTLARVRRRLSAALLAGAVGYGVAGLFLVQGAPDLALTQLLVETLTLVIIVLVLRGLPAHLGPRRARPRTRRLRLALSAAAGTLVALLAVAASAARRDPAVSAYYTEHVKEAGAHNVVNAIIVDFRAMDTLGEIAVLLVAAIGVGALILLPAGAREAAGAPVRSRPPAADRYPDTARWGVPQDRWLPEAENMPAHDRLIMLEVVTRLLFPSILVLSVYLLYSGHLRPGGGFAGGLVAGQAFTLRYLVGGRIDVAFAGRVDPRVIAGAGLALAATAGLAPIAFGGEPLATALPSVTLPVFGHLELSTSVVFDTGVYLLVVGVCLKLLAAMGPAQAPVEEAPRPSGGEPGGESGGESGGAGQSVPSDAPGSRGR
ncbi:Na+/H+ antiporter subunit A [Streptomyces pini]|uniref:Multisubunit sodium/proton antiporter, MrpA subunit /multisubunit sodium/proton antiporter, MrpB subunit n=1 Tax=Streptomyces pini TaxID=1520580 RepID=A0A1I4AQ28_9ACTN|nr:Na+/H+ antiporter subunit A [Streptomyces pini]SFK58474.1 multisubunit sodium/proton antiporter, MrpA subunit /multisubunit sodium/proton antiporter, MrpB subunit [Streptomyces pini]